MKKLGEKEGKTLEDKQIKIKTFLLESRLNGIEKWLLAELLRVAAL